MKERHTGDRSNVFAAAFNPTGVRSVETQTCVSNRETVKQGPQAPSL